MLMAKVIASSFFVSKESISEEEFITFCEVALWVKAGGVSNKMCTTVKKQLR
jgi:hypothetical protein